jgi:hypothetical protein
MAERPYMKLYVRDSQAELRQCSLGARGLWLDLRCLMHDGRPYGHLTDKAGRALADRDVAIAISRPIGEVRRFLKELDEQRLVERTRDEMIFSSAMVRREELRSKRAAGGCQSVLNPNVRQPGTGDRVPIAKGVRFEILKRDGFRCRYCGAGVESGRALVIDHIKPISKGGADYAGNYLTACSLCNLGKSNTPLEELQIPEKGGVQ